MKTIKGIITETTDEYVPINTMSIIWLDDQGLVNAVYRLIDGTGTYLFSHYDRLHTKYLEGTQNEDTQ